MSVYSVSNFIQKNSQKDDVVEPFQLENDYLLKIDLDGSVWTKMGSMVAYRGNIHFRREGILEHGLGKLVKKSFTGEGTHLTCSEGKGELFLADRGKKISILNLNNESIYVNGNDILAFDKGINWDIKMMRRIAGILSGGLFNIYLEGTGYIAITTYYTPLVLKVTRQNPVITDPNATVAWSSSLSPQLKTDMSVGTFFGRGSGESIQMLFEGEGFVVVQPYEEIYMQQNT